MKELRVKKLHCNHNLLSMDIQRELFALQDKDYALFASKLNPSLFNECFIGVRVPKLRAFAKRLRGQKECAEFLLDLPHYYYDENMLHAILLSSEPDYNTAINQVDAFLPYVDNWAVCDTLSPKVFKAHKKALVKKAQQWVSAPEPFACRFGIKIFMDHFLDEDFKPHYLEIPASVKRNEYYVQMMLAWYYATALAKQWDATIPYLENRRLDKWVHNKTIQKARESFRITPDQKHYLSTLRISKNG